MKINGLNRIGYVNQTYRKNNENVNKSAEGKSDPSSMRDSIQLSEASRDIKQYIEKMDTTETIDKERVERIKAAIENGTYQVSAKELAAAIADNILEQNKPSEE